MDVKSAQEVINRIKEHNIPVVLFNREPLNMNPVQSYDKAYFVGTDVAEAGIQTKELALTVCNWDREVAKVNFESLFLYYDGKIEAIISNNDEMAIGAIEVLQKYEYNKGDNTKTIAVVGVDAIPAAQELIKQRAMTGSVVQDASAMAEACYTIGMNLANNRKPLDGTPYKSDDTGAAVRILYKEYID